MIMAAAIDVPWAPSLRLRLQCIDGEVYHQCSRRQITRIARKTSITEHVSASDISFKPSPRPDTTTYYFLCNEETLDSFTTLSRYYNHRDFTLNHWDLSYCSIDSSSTILHKVAQPNANIKPMITQVKREPEGGGKGQEGFMLERQTWALQGLLINAFLQFENRSHYHPQLL